VNRGGPTETIVHGETGWLADPRPEAFADALGRHFSRRAFGDRLESSLLTLAGR